MHSQSGSALTASDCYLFWGSQNGGAGGNPAAVAAGQGFQRAGSLQAPPDCPVGVSGSTGPDLGAGHGRPAGRCCQAGAGVQAKEPGKGAAERPNDRLQADLVDFRGATTLGWWSRMCSQGRWPPRPCPTSGLKKDLAGKVARDGGVWAEHVDEAIEAYNARPHHAVTVAPEGRRCPRPRFGSTRITPGSSSTTMS